jgi:hypothetical protein
MIRLFWLSFFFSLKAVILCARITKTKHRLQIFKFPFNSTETFKITKFQTILKQNFEVEIFIFSDLKQVPILVELDEKGVDWVWLFFNVKS